MNLLPFIPGPDSPPSLRRTLLAWLLYMANQRRNSRFFEVKRQILLSHGAPDGYDLQILEHRCWECDGEGCHRCTDGVYSARYNCLYRYHIEGWTFHIPWQISGRHELDHKIANAKAILRSVKSYPFSGQNRAAEAQLWILLLCDERPAMRRFRWETRLERRASPGLWPLLCYQWLRNNSYCRRHWLHNLRVRLAHWTLSQAFHLACQFYPRRGGAERMGSNRATFRQMGAANLIRNLGTPRPTRQPDELDVPF